MNEPVIGVRSREAWEQLNNAAGRPWVEAFLTSAGTEQKTMGSPRDTEVYLSAAEVAAGLKTSRQHSEHLSALNIPENWQVKRSLAATALLFLINPTEGAPVVARVTRDGELVSAKVSDTHLAGRESEESENANPDTDDWFFVVNRRGDRRYVHWPPTAWALANGADEQFDSLPEPINSLAEPVGLSAEPVAAEPEVATAAEVATPSGPPPEENRERRNGDPFYPTWAEAARIPVLYQTENMPPGEALCRMKYFGASYTFWLTEYDWKSNEAFGYVTLDGHTGEWGYTDLAETEQVVFNVPMRGMGRSFTIPVVLERDQFWEPTRIAECNLPDWEVPAEARPQPTAKSAGTKAYEEKPVLQKTSNGFIVLNAPGPEEGWVGPDEYNPKRWCGVDGWGRETGERNSKAAALVAIMTAKDPLDVDQAPVAIEPVVPKLTVEKPVIEKPVELPTPIVKSGRDAGQYFLDL